MDKWRIEIDDKDVALEEKDMEISNEWAQLHNPNLLSGEIADPIMIKGITLQNDEC